MRRLLRRYLPDPEKLHEHRILRVLGNRLLHPALWHLNRRSVSSAVAIGLFCGLIPGPLQMLAAAVACLYFRANLPVALAATWYTNPLTIVPLYVAAFWLGETVTGGSATFLDPPGFHWDRIPASFAAYWEWMSGLGRPLAIGVFLLAVILAGMGFVTVRLAWRLHITWRLRKKNSQNHV